MNAHEINTAEVFRERSGQHSGHRGPYAAGGADRYYGKDYAPNFTYHGYKFIREEMTPEQIAEYQAGWNAEEDLKDWGSNDVIESEEA